MKSEFSDGPVRGGLWMGELPPCIFKSDLVLSEEVIYSKDIVPGDSHQESIAGIEFFTHRGPRVLYGCVGGTYKPMTDMDGVKIEVRYLDQFVDKCQTPLASGAGDSYIGLEKNYAEAVLSGIKTALQNGADLLPGVIIINAGAISKLASAPIIYERLGERICDALSLIAIGKYVSDNVFKLGL